MYVPAGFPHNTDTNTVVEDETIPVEGVGANLDLFNEISVHLTMGLDTHVWALTYAHIRWTLLQRCGKEWKVEIKNDEDYWDSMRTLPIESLLGNDSSNIEGAIEEVKRVLIRLEPKRWEREALPTDDEINEVLKYMLHDHLASLLEIQDDMYSDIDPHDDNTIIKGYQGTQMQNAVMERYGAFSKNEAMKNAFEERRLSREKKMAGASEEL